MPVQGHRSLYHRLGDFPFAVGQSRGNQLQACCGLILLPQAVFRCPSELAEECLAGGYRKGNDRSNSQLVTNWSFSIESLLQKKCEFVDLSVRSRIHFILGPSPDRPLFVSHLEHIIDLSRYALDH